jgi:Zn-dependent peptidase ImmA (M78 family)/transcriptional regulator with XRE-family HTH domain
MHPNCLSTWMHRLSEDEMETIFRGDLLRLARQARQVTQTQLSSSSEMSQAFISMIEDGIRTPTETQVVAFSQALGFPCEFFYQPDPILGTGVGELFHRKRKSIPKKELDAIHAWMNIKTIALRRLIAPIEWPEVDVPTYRGSCSAEEAAQRLRSSWYVNDGPILSVTDLMHRAGILIVPLETRNQKIDAIGQWTADTPPLIFVNPSIPPDRLRFTLLHELGHLILHRRTMDLDLNESIEDEADTFAAEFLMPSSMIKKELRQLDMQRLSGLKLKWRVSMQSVLVRAEQLGAISSAGSRKLWTEFGRNGWRLNEPVQLDVHTENPFQRYDELLSLYQSQLRYSALEIGKKVHLSTADVKSSLLRSHADLRLVVG